MLCLFSLTLMALLPSVKSAVTVYNDRDQYLEALGNANIIEATALRKNKGWKLEDINLEWRGQPRDFEQCGLTFKWGGGRKGKRMQMRFGDHKGSRYSEEKTWKGGAVWLLWQTPVHDNNTIVTEYPFYALGFDHGSGNSPSRKFGVKIPGEETIWVDRKFTFNGSPSVFFGFIKDDGEPVSQFEIVPWGNESTENWNRPTRWMFTNVAYATPDDTAVTSVGCYNRNVAARTCWATGWGDPHLITWDGLKFDVHAKGEVVMAKSKDSNFEIQARLQGLREPSTKGPAVTTGIVVNDPGFPTLQVNMATTSSSTTQMFSGCPVDLYVNQQATNISSWEGAQGARIILKEDSNKIIVEYVESNIRLDMRVKNYRGVCLFSVDYFLADCYNDEKLVGLLGSPDGNYTNDWMTPDDEVLPLPDDVSKFFFEDAYTYAVDNWCLRTASESYFAYESDKDFYDYANCGNAYDPTLEQLLDDVPAELDTVCNGDIGCILDGQEIGVDAAEDYQADPAVERQEILETEAPSTAPSVSTAPSALPSTAPSVSPSASPSKARSEAKTNGDPHFKTWKKEHFEFHGQCDMILVRDPEFANGTGIEVQIRTKMVRFWSYIKTASILIGNDVLEIEGSTDPDDHETHYWFNFEYQGEADSIGGFPMSISRKGYQKRFFEIDLGSKFPGQKIVLSTFREFVAIEFEGSTEESFGNTVGMFGDYKTGKTLARDGVTDISDYTELGNEWQVLPADPKMFHAVEEPQFPRRCLIPEDPRGERRRRLSDSEITVEVAEAACSKALNDSLDIKDCVYDILATQDMSMVGAF